jgi:hypothetical protein
MAKPSIAFVVGHSNWGKSQTLRALTGGSHSVRRTEVDDVEFFVRRMSNDDLPNSFIERMKSIDPAVWPYVIAALCPKFDDQEVPTDSILDGLRKKGYRLFFWVIQKKYGTTEAVSPKEISVLRRFGKVEVLAEQYEANVRARRFKSFIKQVVLA